MRKRRAAQTSRAEAPEPPERLSKRLSRRYSRQGIKHSAGNRRVPVKLARGLLVLGLSCCTVLLIFQANVFAQDGPSLPPTGDHGNLWINLGIVFLLILISGFFAMAEMAFISVRRTRIEQLTEEGSRAAQMVHQLLSEPTRML